MDCRILVVGLVVSTRVDAFDQSTVSEVIGLQANLLHLSQKLPSLFYLVAAYTDVYHGIESHVVCCLARQGAFALAVPRVGSSLNHVKDSESLIEEFLVSAALQDGIEGDQVWHKHSFLVRLTLILAKNDILDQLNCSVDLVASHTSIYQNVKQDFTAEAFHIVFR